MAETLKADVAVYGTGLVSILIAAGLSSQGIKVILIDPNPDYGSNYRTLNLKNYITQILKGVETTGDITGTDIAHSLNKMEYKPKFISTETKPSFVFNPFSDYTETSEGYKTDNTCNSVQNIGVETLSNFNNYHIDLLPKMLYGNSPAVALLIATGCDDYVQFTAVEGSYICKSNYFTQLPGTKSAIFRSEAFTQLQKRSLCKFLENLDRLGNSNLPDDITTNTNSISVNDIIKYGLARVHDMDKPSNLINRIKLYTTSLGIYGRHHSPFIYPLYGTSDIVQALARTASLTGTLCMLRSRISNTSDITAANYDCPKTLSTMANNDYDCENKFNLLIKVETYNSLQDDLNDVTHRDIFCNLLITESHLQNLPYTDNKIADAGLVCTVASKIIKKHHLVIPNISAHVGVFITVEKIMQEGVSTAVILDKGQTYLLQLDASSGVVPYGYYIYYMISAERCNCTIFECFHMLKFREFIEKNSKPLSSILFASHHDTINHDSTDARPMDSANINSIYNCGMAMTFVDETYIAIDIIKKVKNAFAGEVTGDFSSDITAADGECLDLILPNTFGNKIKKKPSVSETLSALVEKFEEYSVDEKAETCANQNSDV